MLPVRRGVRTMPVSFKFHDNIVTNTHEKNSHVLLCCFWGHMLTQLQRVRHAPRHYTNAHDNNSHVLLCLLLLGSYVDTTTGSTSCATTLHQHSRQQLTRAALFVCCFWGHMLTQLQPGVRHAPLHYTNTHDKNSHVLCFYVCIILPYVL